MVLQQQKTQLGGLRLIAAVYAGSIAVGMDGSVRSKADVAHVAGALIRSALPMHYHITVNGGRI
jgi:hypothetical protein